MQNVAENWLVPSKTGSAFYLGLDAFLQQLPIMLFTLIGGVLADRLDRRRTLLVSQYIQMSTAFTLAALVFFDVVQVWHILTLSFITGTAQAFGGPASQALVPTLVEKNDLPNAIALNSIQFNLARVVGPLLAGGALAMFGMTSCFSLNGVSFLVVIVALMALHVKHTPPAAPRRIHEELRGGLSYVRRQGSLLALTVLAFATTFLAFAVLTFLPLFAKNIERPQWLPEVTLWPSRFCPSDIDLSRAKPFSSFHIFPYSCCGFSLCHCSGDYERSKASYLLQRISERRALQRGVLMRSPLRNVRQRPKN